MITTRRAVQAVVAAIILAAAVAMFQLMSAGSTHFQRVAGLAGTSMAASAGLPDDTRYAMSGKAGPASRNAALHAAADPALLASTR